MKKILEIEGEVESWLTAVVDAALKGHGLAIKPHVDKLVGSIKQVPDDKQE